MSDINLLPDELRKKEEAERQATPKQTPPPFTWREPTLVKPMSVPRPVASPPPAVPKPSPRQTPLAADGGGLKPIVPQKMTTPMQQPRMRTSPQGAIGVDLLAASGGSSTPSISFFHIATVSAIVIGTTLMLLVGGWLLLRQAADARENRANELERERVVARKNLLEATQSMEVMKNLAERLRLAKTLLDGHPSTGRLFTFLERETHAKVQLTSIVMRPEENRVLLEVITLDVPSLVGQLLHWAGNREIVSSLTVASVTRQERPEFVGSVYSFDVSLEFVSSFFHPFISVVNEKAL